MSLIGNGIYFLIFQKLILHVPEKTMTILEGFNCVFCVSFWASIVPLTVIYGVIGVPLAMGSAYLSSSIEEMILSLTKEQNTQH